MASQRPSGPTVTIPWGCRDDVVPLFDRRAEPLVSFRVAGDALSSLVAGFDSPGPDPRTHLVLATVEGRGRLLLGGREHDLVPGTVAVCPAHTPRHQWADEPWRLVTVRLAEIEPWRRFRGYGPVRAGWPGPATVRCACAGNSRRVTHSDERRLAGLARSRSVDEFLNRFGAQLNRDPNSLGPSVPTEPFTLYAIILRIQLEALLAGPPSLSDDERHLARLWEAVRREPGRNWSVESLAAHLSVSRRNAAAHWSPAITGAVQAPSSSASGWTTPPDLLVHGELAGQGDRLTGGILDARTRSLQPFGRRSWLPALGIPGTDRQDLGRLARPS